jgi:hypothetical protein
MTMADEVIGYSAARHPGQHRDRVSLCALFSGLFAAPIVWAGNLMVTYAISVHACYPGSEPLDDAMQGFGFAWPLMLACYIATLAICAIAAWLSYRNWEITGRETEGHIHHLMERGEGRTRYLALIGMSFSVIFFAVTFLGVIIFAIEPLCVNRL